jgi:hypothetical protein
MGPKLIRGASMLSFSPSIGFGCICARRDLQPIGNQSYNHEEMDHFTSLRGSMTMLIKLICEVSMVLVLLFHVSDLTLFDICDDSRLNPFGKKRERRAQFGSITRAWAKKFKEALNVLVQNI